MIPQNMKNMPSKIERLFNTIDAIANPLLSLLRNFLSLTIKVETSYEIFLLKSQFFWFYITKIN